MSYVWKIFLKREWHRRRGRSVITLCCRHQREQHMIIAAQKLPRKWGGWDIFKDGGDIKNGGDDLRMGGG